MLSNHYPLAFATQYNWIIAALVFLMGVTIRHYFNTMHARGGNPIWTWPATVLLFLAIIWLSIIGGPEQADYDAEETRAPTAFEAQFAQAEGFEDVTDIVLGRCSMCHAREPGWDGIAHAPKNILLETPNEIARAAQQIYLQSGVSEAMPPANLSWMEPEERAMIRDWYKRATGAAS